MGRNAREERWARAREGANKGKDGRVDFVDGGANGAGVNGVGDSGEGGSGGEKEVCDVGLGAFVVGLKGGGDGCAIGEKVFCDGEGGGVADFFPVVGVRGETTGFGELIVGGVLVGIGVKGEDDFVAPRVDCAANATKRFKLDASAIQVRDGAVGVVLGDVLNGFVNGDVGAGGEFALVFAGGTRGCGAGVGATEDAFRDVADMGGVVAVGDSVLGRHGWDGRGKMRKMVAGKRRNRTRSKYNTHVDRGSGAATCGRMSARAYTLWLIIAQRG